MWPPLQRQAGLWLAQVQVQVKQAVAVALRRPSAQAQLGVGQVAQSEAVQGVEGQAVEGQAAAVQQQPQQAALRVRAKQAQQFRVVFVLAGLAFPGLFDGRLYVFLRHIHRMQSLYRRCCLNRWRVGCGRWCSGGSCWRGRLSNHLTGHAACCQLQWHRLTR